MGIVKRLQINTMVNKEQYDDDKNALHVFFFVKRENEEST